MPRSYGVVAEPPMSKNGQGHPSLSDLRRRSVSPPAGLQDHRGRQASPPFHYSYNGKHRSPPPTRRMELGFKERVGEIQSDRGAASYPSQANGQRASAGSSSGGGDRLPGISYLDSHLPKLPSLGKGEDQFGRLAPLSSPDLRSQADRSPVPGKPGSAPSRALGRAPDPAGSAQQRPPPFVGRISPSQMIRPGSPPPEGRDVRDAMGPSNGHSRSPMIGERRGSREGPSASFYPRPYYDERMRHEDAEPRSANGLANGRFSESVRESAGPSLRGHDSPTIPALPSSPARRAVKRKLSDPDVPQRYSLQDGHPRSWEEGRSREYFHERNPPRSHERAPSPDRMHMPRYSPHDPPHHKYVREEDGSEFGYFRDDPRRIPRRSPPPDLHREGRGPNPYEGPSPPSAPAEFGKGRVGSAQPPPPPPLPGYRSTGSSPTFANSRHHTNPGSAPAEYYPHPPPRYLSPPLPAPGEHRGGPSLPPPPQASSSNGGSHFYRPRPLSPPMDPTLKSNHQPDPYLQPYFPDRRYLYGRDREDIEAEEEAARRLRLSGDPIYHPIDRQAADPYGPPLPGGASHPRLPPHHRARSGAPLGPPRSEAPFYALPPHPPHDMPGGMEMNIMAGPSSAGGAAPAPRRRGKLPKPVTDLLRTWLLEHASHPYPTEEEKRRLCGMTGLTISQVSNWFINARRRILLPQTSPNNPNQTEDQVQQVHALFRPSPSPPN